jgi:hypothetical protein
MAYNGPAYPVYGTSIGVIPTYNIGGAAPSNRTIDMRSLDYGAAGPEQPYDVYRFSGHKVFWEFPDHNPFLHVPPYY